jgi:hydrogenase-4 component F
MKMAFSPADTAIRIRESAGLLWPQYTLLSTSLILCFWMPDSLHQTIIQAVSAIGGGI